MRFEEAYEGWTESRLTQEEATQLLGVCSRTVRRYINRYEEGGLDGLLDKRLAQASRRRAPVDEAPKRGVHRKRRERTPWPGMMLHQDGSQHQWVEGQYWVLLVTMVVPEPAEGMMPPTSTIRCFSATKKAHRAAFVVCGQPLSATACFARYIRIEVAMTGTHQSGRQGG